MNPHRSSSFCLILTLLTFALYVYQLDGQSLRGDEAFDAIFIRQPFGAEIDELRLSQPYPPLYHVALKSWVNLAGDSVLALRFLSVICMTLVVPLAYQLGRRWFGPSAGRWTALLAAVQPLYYWYAQDRMYAALILVVLASTLTASRLWQGRRSRALWISHSLLTLLCLATHYLALFAIIAQNLVALWQVRRHGRRGYVTWLSTQIVTGLIYLPWIIFAWPMLTSHTSNWTQPVTLLEMLTRLLRGYSVGLTITPAQAALPVIAGGFVALLGLLMRPSPTDRTSPLVAVILIAVPIAGVYGLSLSRPMFDERYLVFIIAPYLALIGRGLAGLQRWRWAQITLAGVLLVGMSIANFNYRLNPAYSKAPSWKEAFATLQAHAQPGDAIIYTYPDPAPIYYAAGRWPTILLPPNIPIDEPQVRQLAAEVVAQYQRLWLIPQWQINWDPNRLTEQALDSLAERAAELRAGSLPLVLYHTRALYSAERMPLAARLGDDIRLIGATVRAADGTPTRSLSVQPGEAVRVTLYWQTARRLTVDYSVFVQLLNRDGQLQSQSDSWPRNGAYPTSWWQPGAEIVDTVVLHLDPNTPTGLYTLIVGLHDAAGVRLSVAGTAADSARQRITLPVTIQVQSP